MPTVEPGCVTDAATAGATGCDLAGLFDHARFATLSQGALPSVSPFAYCPLDDFSSDPRLVWSALLGHPFMVNILRITDLSAGNPPIQGWETYCATANGVVVYTGNHFAAYSVDDGETFLAIDPYAMCQAFGESFASDQIVIYAPQVDRFIWDCRQTKAI